MLVDLPPFRPEMEMSLTSPEMPVSHDQEYEDPLDDVFGSAPASPAAGTHLTADNNADLHSWDLNTTNAEQSDVPRLRSTHVTNGYRDGIAESKAQFVQEGFDEGYSLGAVLGLKAGWLLGVLEGICRAVRRPVDCGVPVAGSLLPAGSTFSSVWALLSLAKSELAIQSIFGKDYFGQDGIWLYHVPGQEEEDQVTFREVSDAHPLISKWTQSIKNLAAELSLDLDSTRLRDQASPE